MGYLLDEGGLGVGIRGDVRRSSISCNSCMISGIIYDIGGNEGLVYRLFWLEINHRLAGREDHERLPFLPDIREYV